MQFLAFLKDSFRETKSGWMLHIMLLMSGLLILLVASVGFRPVTLKDDLQSHFRAMSFAIRNNSDLGNPSFSIENFSQTDRIEPWKSDYTFDYVVTCSTPEDLAKARESGLPVSFSETEAFLRGTLSYVDQLTVTEKSEPEAAAHMALTGTALPPDLFHHSAKIRYSVQTKGTHVQDALAWRHQASVLFAFDVPLAVMSLREGVYLIEKWLVSNIAGWVTLLVSIIVTAGFIPGLLAKGSLDLLASKPIGRSRLLLYKYVGGLTFVLILTTVTVLGVWAAIGIRSGLWSLNFLAIIPILTFYFAILYSVSTFTAVMTRNALVAILVTGLTWGVFYGVGFVNSMIRDREDAVKVEPGMRAERRGPMQRPVDPDAPILGFIPKSTFKVFTSLQTILPRTYELDDRLGRTIAEGVLTPNEIKASAYGRPPRESWSEMLGVSVAFIAVMLSLSCWRFQTRDY